MLDPAVLGTLIIGLEANRRRDAADANPRAERRAHRRVARRPGRLRRWSAQALVGLARRLEPSTVG